MQDYFYYYLFVLNKPLDLLQVHRQEYSKEIYQYISL